MQYPSYQRYKPSKVDWINEVPEHWETWKVTHGFNLIGSGTTPRSDKATYYQEEGTAWITTSELRENEILETKYKLSEKALSDYSTLKVYKPGALAFAMYGATIGRLGILGIPAAVNQACCVFDEPEQFHTKFFFYWLWMRRDVLISLSVGGGQPNLSQDDLKQVRVPIPSIAEQQKIVDFLDYKSQQIDQLIEKKKSLIDVLEENRIAVITQAVTKGIDEHAKLKPSGLDWLGNVPEHWEVKRLRFSINSNPVKSEISNLGLDTMVSFVPMEAVHEYGGMNLDQEKEIKEVYAGYTYFRNNDVVIAKITPCFENGKGSLVPDLKNGIGFGTTEFHVLRALKNLDEKYLFFLTISVPFREIGASEMLGAGGQKRVPESFIKDFRFGLPPIIEQQAIVEYIQTATIKIDKMKLANLDAISKLEEYRSAVITSAVTGKIDVRDIDLPQESM